MDNFNVRTFSEPVRRKSAGSSGATQGHRQGDGLSLDYGRHKTAGEARSRFKPEYIASGEGIARGCFDQGGEPRRRWYERQEVEEGCREGRVARRMFRFVVASVD